MLKGICAFLDVRVNFIDHRNGDSFEHTPDIYTKNASLLIDELPLSEDSRKTLFFDVNACFDSIRTDNGDVYGRAALDIDAVLDSRAPMRGFHSIGGIIAYPRGNALQTQGGARIPFFGVVEAKTERAARDMSSSDVSYSALDSWLIRQVNSLDTSVLRRSEVMKIAAFAIAATGAYAKLPFAFHKGEVRDGAYIAALASSVELLYAPVNWRYETWPEIMGYGSLRSEFFEADSFPELIVLGEGSERLLGEEQARMVKKGIFGEIGRDELLNNWAAGSALIGIVERVWGCKCACRLETRPIFNTRIASLTANRWVVVIQKTNSSLP
jgi:hypothetical protein